MPRRETQRDEIVAKKKVVKKKAVKKKTPTAESFQRSENRMKTQIRNLKEQHENICCDLFAARAESKALREEANRLYAELEKLEDELAACKQERDERAKRYAEASSVAAVLADKRLEQIRLIIAFYIQVKYPGCTVAQKLTPEEIREKGDEFGMLMQLFTIARKT